MGKKAGIGERLGEAFAHLQDFTDDLLSGLFSRLKKLEDNKKPPVKTNHESDENTLISTFKSVARSGFSFLGKVGKSYYDTYEKLKKNKKKE